MFQHTAARRRLASEARQRLVCWGCFNTQPPEGGWETRETPKPIRTWFQHTAARRRLAGKPYTLIMGHGFQHTAARRRLVIRTCATIALLSFNTQPPEGGWYQKLAFLALGILFQHTAARRRLESDSGRGRLARCFNTQPPEGGWISGVFEPAERGGFNTQPPEGGWLFEPKQIGILDKFQHTAARRRLETCNKKSVKDHQFQHTAARRRLAKHWKYSAAM